jgi:hypothetical protein
LRPAKKQLPPSPLKKQMKEQRSAEPLVKAVKHPLETEDVKVKSVNYTSTARPAGQVPHGQDTKRRRTDEVEDKEIINSKPMRVSVVKQVPLQSPYLTCRTRNQ